MNSNARAWHLWIFLGLALVPTGCASRLSDRQRFWLAQGRKYYEHKDYNRAIDHLSRFLAEVHDVPQVAEALYVRGMSHAESGDRASAYADLQRCVALPANPDTTWRAYVVLGTLHFEDQQWVRAAQALRSAAERIPSQPPKDAVLFRLGLCYERVGRWHAARRFYDEIARDFATGGYGDAARRRLRLQADHYAVQCGAFRVRTNADKLCRSLYSRGLDAYVYEEVRGRTPLYVVLVGRCANYAEAQRQLDIIKDRSVPGAILWP